MVLVLGHPSRRDIGNEWPVSGPLCYFLGGISFVLVLTKVSGWVRML
jgi:hypothetical protein